MFKRITVLIVALALMLSLSGCLFLYFEADRTYELLYDASDIEVINIYHDPEGVGHTLPEEPTAQVSPERYEMFVEELKLLPFTEGYLIVFAAADPSFYFGEYVVEVLYSNGACDIISNWGYQEYRDTDRKLHGRHYDCDDAQWEQFVTQYME